MKPTHTNDFLSSALLCAAAHELPATAEPVVMFMPGGMQTITPFAGGIGSPIEVMVDRAGALALNQQLTALAAKGRKPYFDFEHSDDGASFWPTEFFWAELPRPGIYARGEWTSDGKSGVEGKRWRQFSPVFHVDNKAAKPARIICNADAKPNMGGLVNDPAFANILPLWAKNATGAESGTTNTYDMNEQEVQALRDRIKELEGKIAEYESKGATDEVSAARMECKKAELKLAKAELENGELKAKNAKADTEIQAQRAASAEAAVNAAITRGAIAAKDDTTIQAWKADIIADPSRAALLAKMGGSSAVTAGRMTASQPSGVTITAEAPASVMRAYCGILAKNAALPLSAETARQKDQLARESAALFSKDIASSPIIGAMTVEEALKCADFSDANMSVGMLSGTLVLQQSLPAMMYEFPLLGAITTDVSSEVGAYNQTQTTRVTLKPAVQSYDNTLGTDGRPKGWVTASPAQAVDIPVTLNEYIGVPIVFGVAQLASTARKLFDESAPMASYAMGEYVVGKITALCTAGNFNAYAGTSLAAGATTSGSKTVTVTSTANAFVGAAISGTGIPANTYVAEVVNATTLTLTNKATATGSGLTLTLSGGKVPTTYATYVKALASWAVAGLDDIAAALDTNEVPFSNRFAMLNSAYYRKLGSDSQINALMTGTGNAAYLTERKLPKISNFELLNAPYFPSSSNRTGFAGHKASLVLKTRLPQDLSGVLQGASFPGSTVTVTDPATGLSMLLVQFINPTGNYAEWRPELMFGVAVGDRRGGLVITSA